MTQPRRIISVAVFVAALLLLPRFPVGLLGIFICAVSRFSLFFRIIN